VLAVAVLLFAYSTIISWGYYSSKVWTFIFGFSRRSQTIFKIVYVVALIPGAVMTVGQVIDVMDSFFFLMAVPNIIGIYLMAGEIKRDTFDYLARLRDGRIRPTAEAVVKAAQ